MWLWFLRKRSINQREKQQFVSALETHYRSQRKSGQRLPVYQKWELEACQPGFDPVWPTIIFISCVQQGQLQFLSIPRGCRTGCRNTANHISYIRQFDDWEGLSHPFQGKLLWFLWNPTNRWIDPRGRKRRVWFLTRPRSELRVFIVRTVNWFVRTANKSDRKAIKK